MTDSKGTSYFSWFKFISLVDRVAAWILLLVILAYAISGYGMTKGLIDRNAAAALHLGWLGGIGLFAFVVHSSFAVHLAFRRWHIWNIWGKALLFLAYAAIISFFIYVNFFYVASTVDSGVGFNASLADYSALPVFDAGSLSAYDGLKGHPAYAAVDGLVYDFSSLFRNGKHAGHSAGRDLSAAFHSEHPNNLLDRYQVVGTYAD